MASVAPGFPIPGNWSVGATFSWDSFNHIRVYGLKPDGTVVEFCYDNGTWSGPQAIGGTAAPGSTIAVTYYQHNDGVSIRLYFHDNTGRLRELCYDGGWSLGAFNFPGQT